MKFRTEQLIRLKLRQPKATASLSITRFIFLLREVFFPLTLLCLLLFSICARAEESEKDETQTSDWGLGIAFGAISFPHYLGANQRDLLALPFPYFEYYGERFSYDDDGLVAKIFSSDRIRLNLSASTALPVNSEDNEARAGMEDLDLILEAGPSLEFTLREWNDAILRIDIPLRLATEIDFVTTPRFAGWSFDPKLYLRTGNDNLKYEFEAGALFGSTNYQSIYYEVEPEFETIDRPVYQSESGMMGWRFSLGARYERDQMRYFGYIRHFNLDRAKNRDSPLFRENDYWAAGVGIAWMLKSPN